MKQNNAWCSYFLLEKGPDCNKLCAYPCKTSPYVLQYSKYIHPQKTELCAWTETEKGTNFSLFHLQQKRYMIEFLQSVCFPFLICIHEEFSDKKRFVYQKNCNELWKGFDLDFALLASKSNFLLFEIKPHDISLSQVHKLPVTEWGEQFRCYVEIPWWSRS